MGLDSFWRTQFIPPLMVRQIVAKDLCIPILCILLWLLSGQHKGTGERHGKDSKRGEAGKPKRPLQQSWQMCDWSSLPAWEERMFCPSSTPVFQRCRQDIPHEAIVDCLELTACSSDFQSVEFECLQLSPQIHSFIGSLEHIEHTIGYMFIIQCLKRHRQNNKNIRN